MFILLSPLPSSLQCHNWNLTAELAPPSAYLDGATPNILITVADGNALKLAFWSDRSGWKPSYLYNVYTKHNVFFPSRLLHKEKVNLFYIFDIVLLIILALLLKHTQY